jgi:hypothetical protein
MLSEDIEEQHVVEQMADPCVNEHCGEEPPVFSVINPGDVCAAPGDEDVRAHGAAGDNLGEQKDDAINDDEAGRDPRNLCTRDEPPFCFFLLLMSLIVPRKRGPCERDKK